MYWGTAAAIHPNAASMMFMMVRTGGGELDTANSNVPRSIIRDRHDGHARFAFADGHGAGHPFAETWDDTIADKADRDNNHKTDWYDPRYPG